MFGTRPRTRVLIALPVLLMSCDACTTYRIVRYREPDARNNSMFPSRPVRRADTPFQFAAAAPRTDLDTITVRAPNAERIPFSRYLRDYDILAFLVIRNDTILYENYRGGYDRTRASITFSVSKSILSMLLGIAIDEGAIKSLDQLASDYVPELRGRPAFDGVTLRHLLEMRSGLLHTEAEGGFLAKLRSDEAQIYYTTNLLRSIENTKRAVAPGSAWAYKDTDAELLGLVLARATGRSVSAYTEEKVWRRIGAESDAAWSLDHRDGQEKVSSGFIVTARDLAKVGRLYLNGGQWEGQQIVPATWVAQSSTVDTTRAEPEISNWWQMQHHTYWWHPLQPPHGDFYADGSRGQRLYVDPRTRTIIVQLANNSAQDFPFRKIAAYLSGVPFEYPRSIPALVRQAALTFGADSVRPVYLRLEAERRANPSRYVITEAGMRTVGRLLLDSAKVAPAVEVLELATERSPNSARAWIGLADAYEKAGNRTETVAALRRALELTPGDSTLVRRLSALGAR